MRVAVLGLGYVGAVTAACLSNDGHHVVGIDPDLHKVEALRSGRSPVVEPGCGELIAQARRNGTLEVSRSEAAARGCDVLLVCVATPSDRAGHVDLSAVDSAARQIGELLLAPGPGPVVLYRSTLPPGTLQTHLVPLMEEASGRTFGVDLHAGTCPEFLRETTAVADFRRPPFTVVGAIDSPTVEAARSLFSFVDAPFHVVTPDEAEALKLCCNAFHALKVVFSNEVGRLCRATGVDGRAVMRLFCEDRQLNISSSYLKPGFSYGGSCLTKDLRALSELARRHDVDLPMLSHVAVSNDRHRDDVLDRVIDLGARSVALLGLSFKSGTDDLRESPYVALAEALSGKGIEVRIYDANVNPQRLFGANLEYVGSRLPHLRRFLTDDPSEALADAECALVATSDQAVVTALKRHRPQAIIDLRGDLPLELESLPGYEGVAW
jgi:GDP-mannose 6-dehydrogenase